MSTGDGGTVDCGSCGDAAAVDEASMLEARDSKGVWRYLCPDCLADLTVPKGYRIRRDLSFLRGGSTTSSPGDGTAESAGAATTVEEPTQGSAVAADFLGRVATADDPQGGLRAGRVLMDRRRIVLATGTSRTVIPLAEVQDVAPAGESAGEDVLGIAYRTGGDAMAFVGAADDTLRQFATVLFRALLSGTAVSAKVGQSQESSTESGMLALREERIDVSGTDVSVDLDGVTDVEHRDRGWARGDRDVLAVSHRRDGGSIVTEVALPSARKRDLLGRFLRDRT